MRLFYKGSVLILAALFIAVPHVALSDDGTVVTSKLYVDSTKVAINQGAGTNNANVGKTLVVNSSGNLELSSAALPNMANIEMTTNKLDGGTGNTVAGNSSNTTKYTSAKAVADYAIQKPASASEGKVLTYGASATADSQPVAQYVKVPVATGDPNASGATAPTAFSSVWIQ